MSRKKNYNMDIEELMDDYYVPRGDFSMNDIRPNTLSSPKRMMQFLNELLDRLLDTNDANEEQYTDGYWDALKGIELDDDEDYTNAYLSGYSDGENLKGKGYDYAFVNAKRGGNVFNSSSRKKFIR